MSIVAPYSKYKKTNLKIYIGLCVAFAIIFAYDGYLSKYQWSLRRSFYEKHVTDGKPDENMIFNQVAPFFLVAIAGALAVRLWVAKNKKIILAENSLVLPNQTISCDSIEAIDKTFFDAKGFFTITYKNQKGDENTLKISYKKYDNLTAVLDELVAKIS